MAKYHKFKAEITVGGSGFDTPTSLTIEKDADLPTATMIFPNATASRFKIQQSDLVKIYVGLDALPEYPTFTGYIREERGKLNNRIAFVGDLYPAVRDYRIIDDINNLDGQEIGNAIKTIHSSVAALSGMATFITKTNPVITVPKDFRFPTAASKYDLMKQLRDMAVDPADPTKMLRYCIYTHDNAFYFKKMPNPDTATPSITLTYGDSLLDIDPDATSRQLTNAVKVFGKDKVYAYFQNTHRVVLDTLREDEPIQDDTILSDGEAFDVARAHVLSGITDQMGYVCKSHELLECLPNVSVIGISQAPYGFSGNYLLKTLNISASPGQFEVSGKIAANVDVVSEILSKLLKLT